MGRLWQREVERNGIICLQEVSRLWAGQLHVYFSQRGYHFVTGTRRRDLGRSRPCGAACTCL